MKTQKKIISFEKYGSTEPVVKVFNFENKLINFEDSSQDKFDSTNRKILKGIFQTDYNRMNEKITLAHPDLVIPVYLIEIQEETSVEEIVQYALNSDFFKSIASVIERSEKSQNVKNAKNKMQQKLKKELEKEVDARQHLKLLRTLGMDIKKTMCQLSFDFSSIFQTDIDENTTYKMELLQKNDADYKFILRSLKDKNTANNPKIMYLLKFNPVDKTLVNPVVETYSLKDKYLYLRGIEHHKVENILNRGFLQKCKKKIDTPLTRCTTSYKQEVIQGSGYFEVDEEFKKLSFVLVSGSESEYGNVSLNNMEVIKDSRESCAVDGLFSDDTRIDVQNAMIPAYLVIIDLDDH